jgi:hypothetical protein
LNPGLLFLRRVRCPLGHAARASFKPFLMVTIFIERSYFLASVLRRTVNQGCQIFIGPNLPKLEKYTPNDHKLYQTAVNYTKWPKNCKWP